MEALAGPFVEGWALGKYSGKTVVSSSKIHTEYGYLKYGKLVHDYKYESVKLNDEKGKEMRSLIMLEINKSVDYFLNGYFPVSSRQFDSILAVPSSRGSSSTIQNEICIHLAKKNLIDMSGAIHVKEKDRIATKNIPGFQQRLKSVRARFEHGDLSKLADIKGILLIDDIYETGATLRTTVELLNKIVPSIPKYFLTVAYLI